MASSRSKNYGYGSVEITLENCLIPKEKLGRTPSVVDGLNIEIETDFRIVGCEYIQTAGILLKLPQVAMATGQVLFQRFYYSKSLVRHDVEVYAMACLFLAAKVEESPRRIRDVINVFHHIKQKRNNRPIVPMEYLGNTYFTLKNLVIKAERRVLKELGFCVHVQHPHKVVITFLQVLDCEKNQQLAQLAWNFMNDALRTNVFVRYQPETVACACIFLSARQLKIPLPSRPPWWELFDGKIQDIEDVCLTLLQLYLRPKVSLHTLNKAIDRIKKSLPDKKSKTATDVTGEKTNKSSGPTFSQQGSPYSNPSPVADATKSRSGEKNGGSKLTSQKNKSTKKSNKMTETRRENRNSKPISRSLSPVHDKSHSSSGAESESGDSSDSDTASGDSGSSQEESRGKKTKIVQQSRRPREHVDDRGKHGDTRLDADRKLYKSKNDTNSYRRGRDRSRSPYRRSRSGERRNTKLKDKYGRRGDMKGSMSRNGDYTVGDQYEKRGRR